ncbi:LpxI family protein [Parvularcula dongshanensis]|uniref:DUF1009 domain-containing protein n=1 Tax=Parvularcula dongshanensis TaxID=1173995 RepID=A0A840I4V3_9PROT|nr:UDP-2,3-diacylglucosamine diphosphatase LpxI [Parvularcula dongshanensis]MBB4659392.1 hypothetical protein [Parvularcula dongshanensis]
MTARRWRKLGIVAGGGALPARLADACRATGAPFAVFRLRGYADAATEGYDGAECGIAEFGRLLKMLRAAECDAVVMAGTVRRPNFAGLKPDWRGAALLPKLVAAARQGDGALLGVLVETFEAEGFAVLGAEEVAATLAAGEGSLGAYAPDAAALRDVAKGAALIDALGPFDVGQGVVVRDGFVLAVEAAEGTDAMLTRCAGLPADLLGAGGGDGPPRRGVLVKRPKPTQERRVDLPTVGVRTIEGAKAAHLAGVAVEAGAALIVDREAVVSAADEAGLFLYGFTAADLG